ncbi:MAG: hypothetical protein NWE93_01405 [Candidatus Bathyarchaeota archaeon]|nr:hypothetical protein [Candidatus Bathyarchaeota archaeon]
MKADNQYIGEIGVHLVAAKISQMKLIALTTSRNCKGYDIVVLEPTTNKGIGLQVKSNLDKDFPVMQSFLKDYDVEIKKKIIMDYVFVDLSDMEKPRFFVLSKDETKRVLKESIEYYINNSKHRIPIEEMIKNETSKQQWTIYVDDLIPFENNWKTITNNLQSK